MNRFRGVVLATLTLLSELLAGVKVSKRGLAHTIYFSMGVCIQWMHEQVSGSREANREALFRWKIHGCNTNQSRLRRLVSIDYLFSINPRIRGESMGKVQYPGEYLLLRFCTSPSTTTTNYQWIRDSNLWLLVVL